MKKGSVIIPVYNKSEELRMTLEALLNQTMPVEDMEILIADDGSGENIKAVAEEFSKKVALRYFWQADQGFRPGAARNMGIWGARGEVCVFLDCGVIPTSTCLAEHYRLYEQYGEKLAVQGYIYGCDKHSDLEEMRKIIDSNTPDNAAAIMEGKHMLDGRDSDGAYWQAFGDDLTKWAAPWVTMWGGHFSVPTKFLRENDICFDDHFSTWGGEDNELGIQLQNAGATFVVGRNAKAIHYPAKVRSYDKLHTDEEFRMGYKRNKQYIAEKYPENQAVQAWFAQGDRAAMSFEQEDA